MIPAPVSNSYLAEFVAQLEAMPMAAQVGAFSREVSETGGTWIDFEPCQGNDFYGYVELSLHGLTGSGHTVEQALACWKSAAIIETQIHFQEAAE